MSITKALCEGFVAELNQVWKGSPFYFWVQLFTAPSTVPDELGILCQQTLHGKRRQYLKLMIREASVELFRVTTDTKWEKIQTIELANPNCLDSLHLIIKRELAYV